ncbi:MAG: DUF3857 domain-containing protein [Cytophagales bacterium]
MTMKLAFILIISLFVNVALAREIKYSTQTVPANLSKNAKATVRFEEQILEIRSKSSATLKVKKAITIWNRNAEELKDLYQGYDKLINVSGMKLAVYDAYGELAKRYGSSDIKDMPATNEGIFEDNRIKAIIPELLDYPFTVEYQYEVEYKGILELPDFEPLFGYNISVEKSTFTIVKPETYLLRRLLQNTTISPLISNEKGFDTQVWTLSNIPVYKEEAFSKSLDDIAPKVLFSPSEFSYGGYDGNMETWEKLGQWSWELNKDRNKLPEETVAKIKHMVKDAKTDLEKAKILYEYMQNKTRYVSIQVGIGGHQPFEASFVDKKSYGDCKALTNYMKSLLDVAGVKSIYTVIKAGPKIPTSIKYFPSDPFNHIILCVPQAKDTTWLECTSQQMPFGFIGDWTDDRDAFLITENGGQLVHTKVYSEKDNVLMRKIDIDIDEKSQMSANALFKFYGIIYDVYTSMISMSPEEQRKALVSQIVEPHVFLDSYKIEEFKSEKPYIVEKLNLSSGKFGTQLNDRTIVPTNFYGNRFDITNNGDARVNDIKIYRSLTYIDTVIVKVHPSLKLDSVSTVISKKTPFGELECKISTNGASSTIYRKFTLLKGEYPKEKWEEFVKYTTDINKAESIKFLIRKQSITKN